MESEFDKTMTESREHSDSLWLAALPQEETKTMLFCLPYAGGDAQVFSQWQSQLPSSIGVCPIQLPGRENRSSERLICDVLELAELIGEAIRPRIDRPFAFFGHGFGALLAFEVTRHFRRSGAAEPQKLFVSAYSGLRSQAFQGPAHLMSDPDLMEWQNRTNGVSDAVLNAPQSWGEFLSVLRADLEATFRYEYYAEPPLECPITAFAGQEDRLAPASRMLSWRNETITSFSLHPMKGEHYSLNSFQKTVLSLLQDELCT